MMRQLALPLPIAASFDARDVIADASNAAARSWLAQPDTWPLGRLALYGEAGVGKTHLARAAAARFGWRWLDGMGLRGLPAPAPQGNVIDDADCVADETALLHLINLCAERGESLLLIGREAPARWPVRLPDRDASCGRWPGNGCAAARLAQQILRRSAIAGRARCASLATHALAARCGKPC